MIHDVLLSCRNLQSKRLILADFMVSGVVSEFIHPCEKKILEDIIGIVNLLRSIARFGKIYGSFGNATLKLSLLEADEELLPNGQYLKAFANGLDLILNDYYVEITELELEYLKKPNLSMLLVYQKLQIYEPLAHFLRRLISGIQMQKLHGCAIVQYLSQNTQHGDLRIFRAIKTITSIVNVIFLKQLTHWILYAKIMDPYGEFFIQNAETRNKNNSTGESELDCGEVTTTATTSQTATTYSNIWHYDICYEYLPNFISPICAEKVLFIGQTVLIFKGDHWSYRTQQLWNKPKEIDTSDNSLWNEKAHIFFQKLQALQEQEGTIAGNYERVIDEVRAYVTDRLSAIAITQADLEKQLRLIKNYYLLGRGELYLEFIRRTHDIYKDDDECKLRNLVKAFEVSAHSVGASEDLEQFSLGISKMNIDENDGTIFGFLQQIRLEYSINWPLHLIFSPKVMDRYNVLFRFLLLVKRTQYELHMVWRLQTRDSKLNVAQNIKVMNLRNQLMFFVDNLQYFIQVDVLESQFSILHNTILNKADFAQIQRAHSIFQANVIALLFMANDPKDTISQTIIHAATNPVYIIINDIFHLCEEFCLLLEVQDEDFEMQIDRLDKSFGRSMEQLINLLEDAQIVFTTTPLTQLLLRLDFNNWFSTKHRNLTEYF